jgi:hypothetical protein
MFDKTIKGVRRFSIVSNFGAINIDKLKLNKSRTFLTETLAVPNYIRSLRSTANIAMIKTDLKTPYHTRLTEIHKKRLI